jgi:hypothetical protein
MPTLNTKETEKAGAKKELKSTVQGINLSQKGTIHTNFWDLSLDITISPLSLKARTT